MQENYPLPTSLRVGDWVIDPATGLMSRDGQQLNRLDARTLRLLLCMSRFPGTVFPIEELLKQVWPGLNAGEDIVHKTIAAMRSQLRDDPRDPSYIVAFPGVGYKLIAKIEVSSQTSASAEVDSVAAFGPAPAQPPAAAKTKSSSKSKRAPQATPPDTAQAPVQAAAPASVAEPIPAAPVANAAEIKTESSPSEPASESTAVAAPAEPENHATPAAENVLAPDLILKPSAPRRPEALAEPETVVDLDFAIDLGVVPQAEPTLLTQTEEPEAEPDAVPGPPMALDMLTMPDQFDIPEQQEAPKKSVTQASDATPFPQLGAGREGTPSAKPEVVDAAPAQEATAPPPEAPPIPRTAKRVAQAPETTPFPQIVPPKQTAQKASPPPPATPDASVPQVEKSAEPSTAAAPPSPPAPVVAAPVVPAPPIPAPAPAAVQVTPPVQAVAQVASSAPIPTPPVAAAPQPPAVAPAPAPVPPAPPAPIAKPTPAPSAPVDTAELFAPAPKRGIHGSWWRILACLIVIGVCIAGMLVRPPPETPRTVGVLPFIDLTDAAVRDPGAAAMTEQVIGKLAAVPGLIVSPPAVSLSYRDRPASIGEFATAVQVSYVLDGSLRKTGSIVRIAARLSRATDGAVIWKQTYERPWNERPAIQDEIAIEVGNAIAKPTP
ncbi:winged helix-turn-helix domain-containing protein [Massilia sp. CF038]|uniref:winged helix-turn-helix domain-containing protein n=1 Tax=Massilia sp. CF038 TaxID=1881045 RepID=UPI0015B5AA78|nr:winged helix-turn-helix domain-containing protein [Massilia sp. CF038]